MKQKQLPLVITPGEPAGIGPDIVLKVAANTFNFPLVVVADKIFLAERARQLGLTINFCDYDPKQPIRKDQLTVQHIPLKVPGIAQHLNSANASYVLECLQFATQACLRKEFHALVTGPVHKGIIIEAGFTFSGHTEFLAKLTNSPLPVMLMVAETFQVALVTTHIPLAAVSAAITHKRVTETIQVLAKDLTQRFGIDRPRISVCGLNPHAGEGGHIGREEIEIISPALAKLRQQGYHLIGPVSADTAFTPYALQQCDAIVAMYHDQALPVVKAMSFSSGVNVTLGLPIIRTSVDHGTALELAGTGKVDPSSLIAAMNLALRLKH